MNEQELRNFLHQLAAGTQTPADEARFRTWAATLSPEAYGQVLDLWQQNVEAQADYPAIDPDLIRQIETQLDTVVVRKLRRPNWVYAAAAFLIIGIAFGFYFSLVRKTESPEDRKLAQITDIAPGYNQATLTLADGTTVKLDSAQSGIIIGAEHIKYQNGESLPGVMLSGEGGNVRGGVETSLPNLLSLSTPRGGQYQIMLSDGTKVWLNAASTLKYPSQFSGDNRTVEITGEAFFDIKEDKSKPFKVLSKNQEISVLGTSFNVAAYTDEPSARTTLVNGAIQVASYVADQKGASSFELRASSYKLLKPGQQSIISETGIQVKNVDIDSELSWKNNQFIFREEALESIMRKLERWYNVDVVYKNEQRKQARFEGIMTRFNNISEVLRMLELAGDVHFKVENRTVIVY